MLVQSGLNKAAVRQNKTSLNFSNAYDKMHLRFRFSGVCKQNTNWNWI